LPQNLDFDFEKCCSVSLSPINVYVCLVCGKYFQVRAAQQQQQQEEQQRHDVRGQRRWQQQGCRVGSGVTRHTVRPARSWMQQQQQQQQD
jgi:hypothetical protein